MYPWSVGDHLTHRFNPELGLGRVTAIEGRVLVVHFPHTGATLRLAGSNDALVPGTEERAGGIVRSSSAWRPATSTTPTTS